ncbi:MAG: hypothetical protein KAR32_04200, partial [Candidatus Omnitrophica bacterium]|nr:hypothetical protein [Candidatus Omnitrophota bacterium]
MAKNIDKLLAKVLTDKGLVDLQALDDVVKEVEKTGRPFSAVLIEQGLIDESKLLDILAQELKISFVNLRDISIEKSTTETVPLKFASYYKFMPVKIENRVLTVAVAY